MKGFFEVLLYLGLLVLFFLPTNIAFRRRHPRRGWILLLNLLGGTGLLWIVALVWATRAPKGVVAQR